MLDFPMQTEPGGYLLLGDDAIVDPCLFNKFSLENFWVPKARLYQGDVHTREEWYWWGQHILSSNSTLAVALEAALLTLPAKYERMARNSVKELQLREGINVSGVGISVQPFMTDFSYVPNTYVSDWFHLGAHFRRHFVMTEAACPQMVFILAGLDGLEFPPMHNNVNVLSVSTSDQNSHIVSKQLLQSGKGITIPESWDKDPFKCDRNWYMDERRVMLYHSMKMSHLPTRELFLAWWYSLPCNICKHI